MKAILNLLKNLGFFYFKNHTLRCGVRQQLWIWPNKGYIFLKLTTDSLKMMEEEEREPKLYSQVSLRKSAKLAPLNTVTIKQLLPTYLGYFTFSFTQTTTLTARTVIRNINIHHIKLESVSYVVIQCLAHTNNGR